MGGAGMDYLKMLRNSHIFSSAVHEVLAQDVMRDTTDLPLTETQFHLLKLLSIDGRHQVTEVADLLGVSAPAASKNIDKLVRLGLLERSRSEGDRRATLLSVSARGRRLVIRYEQLKAARLYPVLDSFPAEDVEAFAGLLERFSVALYGTESLEGGVCMRCDAYLEADCPIGELQGGCPYANIRANREKRQQESSPQ